jgi:hypothetical protein
MSAWNSARSIDHCGCRFHTANGRSWMFMVVHRTVLRFVKISHKIIFVAYYFFNSTVIFYTPLFLTLS